MNNKLLALLKPEADKIDAIMRRDFDTVSNNLLHEVVCYAAFNGGKRIRPLLTILVARLCQNQPDLDESNLYHFSLCFEYLHIASLLHDDVIDKAEKRRGLTAANHVWSNTHVILAGDFLHSRAMFFASTLANRQCLPIICKAGQAMVNSEFIQLENANTLNDSEVNYYQVLQGKTAALIGAACETGAIFSGGTEQQCQALKVFGCNIGLTFQIVDDVLDYLGDAKKMGKIIGNDFKERQMTLPLIYTLNHTNTTDKQILINLLTADENARIAEFKQVKNIIKKTGGFIYAHKKAQALITEAINALSIFPDSVEKDNLKALALYVLQREK